MDGAPIKDENKKDQKEETNVKQKSFEWTPETVNQVIDAVTKILGHDVVSKYFAHKSKEKENEIRIAELAAKHDRKIVYILLGFLTAVIVILAGLTYYGKVSGEALLFAVGGLIGYIFATINRFIFGSQSMFSPDPD